MHLRITGPARRHLYLIVSWEHSSGSSDVGLDEGEATGTWAVVNQVCDLVELRTGREGTTVRLHMRLAVRSH